jgi:hypothetical protein
MLQSYWSGHGATGVVLFVVVPLPSPP